MAKSIQSVFKRTEKKYLVSTTQFQRLSAAFEPYTQPDAYGTYTICNVYFDTAQNDLIRRSIEKPIFKEKLRARSYGTPSADDKVFLEMKRKFKGVVYKRRVAMRYCELQAYLTTGIHPQSEKYAQIYREIDYFFQFYQPVPKVYLAYDRIALQEKDDPALRITFDSNIRYRQNDVTLGAGDSGTKLLPDGQYIMEIKANGAMPLWLSACLDREHLYPTSFSKYGNIYKIITQKRGA